MRENKVIVGDSYIDYIEFGKGNRKLVIIPGLSIRDIKGYGLMLSTMYRVFAKNFKVYIIDRKHDIEDGYNVWDIADDTVYVMHELGIDKADIMGISQGGMIAQAITLNYPQMVNKLVLGVTLSRQNSVITEVVSKWIEYARAKDYRAINRETITKMYSDKYIKKYSFLIPFICGLSKPRDYHRFEILAGACMEFDCYERLDELKCETFVIGGMQDKIVTGEASLEIAKKLGCDIYMYENLGHAAYEEGRDFNKRVCDFLLL